MEPVREVQSSSPCSRRMGSPAAGIPGNRHGSPLAGGSLVGSLSHRLVATKVCTGCTESVPTSGQGTVPGGRGSGSPWPVDPPSDNGHRLGQRPAPSSTRRRYGGALGRDIKFTHSRAAVKKDLARDGQKKAAVVRRFVGHHRNGPPLPGGADLSEPLPAFLQDSGEDSGGVQGRQAVRSTGHGPRVIAEG